MTFLPAVTEGQLGLQNASSIAYVPRLALTCVSIPAPDALEATNGTGIPCEPG